MRRKLEVHAAQGAAASVVGQALLGHLGLQPAARQLAPAPGASEEATLVAMRLDVEQPDALEPRRREDQAVRSSSGGASGALQRNAPSSRPAAIRWRSWLRRV